MNAQATLDALVGTGADLGYFYSHKNEKVYSCSTRLFNGDLAYGTGATLEDAILNAKTHAPIRSEKVA